MAVFKCKMCGADLNVSEGIRIAECEYCGSTQTLPVIDNEKKLNLFNRANHLRRANDFDRAASIYESIIAEFPEEAESYWGLCLCNYGIEYVDDPLTGDKKPTCHRASFDSLQKDENFKLALDYADVSARKVYRDEAREIDRIMEEILSISKNEKPYDVFICYKEKDDNGERTSDSVLAQDVYDALTAKGLKVFFSRITLEDKLGTAYEPYIFAALNSAKVMLAVGTKYEYFNAVWVRNEWSRFLKLMHKDKSKVLIPCFKDIDPYDIPEEFSHLQAQDMSKIGFMQDIIHGIKKIVKTEPEQTTVVKETVVAGGNANTDALLERAFMFLEDGDFVRADEFCEQVLNQDPKNANAYLGKLMAELHVNNRDGLKDQAQSFDNNNNFKKAVRFADEELKNTLEGYIKHINTRNENTRIEGIYARAVKQMSAAKTEKEYKEAASLFSSICEYKDSASLAKVCYDKAEAARKDAILEQGKTKMAVMIIANYEAAIGLFESVPGWKDADEKASLCQKKLEELNAKAEADSIEKERKAEAKRIRAKKIKKLAAITASAVCAAVCVIIAFDLVLTNVIIPNGKYNDAKALMDVGKYTEAIAAFEELNGYKDSEVKINECNTAILEGKYNDAKALMDVGKYTEAIAAFEELNGYKDSEVKINECNTAILEGKYNEAKALMDVGKYTEAIAAFEELNGYKDSEVKINECNTPILEGKYNDAMALIQEGRYAEAAICFGAIGDFKDAKEKSLGLWEDVAQREAISAGGWHTVGLKSDGTVVAVGDNDYGQCDVSGWTDIVAISTDGEHTVGLKSDGTVVAVGRNRYGQRDVRGWKDIVAISAGYNHTVGLKSDGTVVAVGQNGTGQCDVSGWTDIVAISAGYLYTVGLKSDGTVVAVGSNIHGQCDVSGWKDIKLPS